MQYSVVDFKGMLHGLCYYALHFLSEMINPLLILFCYRYAMFFFSEFFCISVTNGSIVR
jgi:hypothetical protein